MENNYKLTQKVDLILAAVARLYQIYALLTIEITISVMVINLVKTHASYQDSSLVFYYSSENNKITVETENNIIQ